MGNTNNMPSRRRLRLFASCLLVSLLVPGAMSYAYNSDLRPRCRKQLNTCIQKSGMCPAHRLQRGPLAVNGQGPQTALLALDPTNSIATSETSTIHRKAKYAPHSGNSTLLNGYNSQWTERRSVFFATPISNGVRIEENIHDVERNDRTSQGIQYSNILSRYAIRMFPKDATDGSVQPNGSRENIEKDAEKRSIFKLGNLLRVMDRDNDGSKTAQGVKTDGVENPKDTDTNVDLENLSLSRLWRRRQSRTLEEAVRREKATKLSDLLNRAQIDARPNGKRYIERTLMGLINALAEEVEDLDIELTTKPKTPLWRKEVQQMRINFSRLGFKQIRMGGCDKYDRQGNAILKDAAHEEDEEFSLVQSADEAFDRIDKDKSGTLDREEIAQALGMISELETNEESIQELAAELVSLYDVNSDGVVDREEYQLMVEDMAKLRTPVEEATSKSPLTKVKDSVQTISKGISQKAAQVAAAASRPNTEDFDPDEREMGSIVLSDLNLDLRRLVFGGVPLLKRITPGGPLILEPFTATVRGSFTRQDVMGSFLLDAGLRLLVARAIRVRVRSFRDVVDGAYFFGRQWKMTSKTAPVVQVLGLSNLEFSGEKMILTGRARIRASPDAPVVTNTFKVRTKIGTGNNGHTIGLREPELAFVFECPQAWENGISFVCDKLGMSPPKRPDPLYFFFPIYSPFKVNEQAGFDMGDDNRVRKIFIKDGKLRFEMRSILRPGRFLGSHYLAFTVPMRTFIITMDRVKEGIRVARKNKKIATREKQLLLDAQGELSGNSTRDASGRRILKAVRKFASGRFAISFPLKPTPPKRKSFFTRFVEGYTLVEREGVAKNEQLTNEISDWFGRQGQSNETIASDTDPDEIDDDGSIG